MKKPTDETIDLTAERRAHAEDQEAMKLIVTLLRAFTVERYARRIKTALEVGPIMDPTLFRKNGPSLQIELELAEAVQECRAKLNAIAQRELPRLAELAAAEGLRIAEKKAEATPS